MSANDLHVFHCTQPIAEVDGSFKVSRYTSDDGRYVVGWPDVGKFLDTLHLVDLLINEKTLVGRHFLCVQDVSLLFIFSTFKSSSAAEVLERYDLQFAYALDSTLVVLQLQKRLGPSVLKLVLVGLDSQTRRFKRLGAIEIDAGVHKKLWKTQLVPLKRRATSPYEHYESTIAVFAEFYDDRHLRQLFYTFAVRDGRLVAVEKVRIIERAMENLLRIGNGQFLLGNVNENARRYDYLLDTETGVQRALKLDAHGRHVVSSEPERALWIEVSGARQRETRAKIVWIANKARHL